MLRRGVARAWRRLIPGRGGAGGEHGSGRQGDGEGELGSQWCPIHEDRAGQAEGGEQGAYGGVAVGVDLAIQRSFVGDDDHGD